MPLIKNNEFENDAWQHIDDDADVPEDTQVIVSYKRLTDETDVLVQKSEKLGVLFPNDQDVQLLEPYLEKLSVIALEFPKFADGRAYSQARLIREELGFEGELRATGDVLPDQAVSMMRCGFDAFEVSESVSLDIWNRAVEILNHMYQRSYAVSGDVVRIDDGEEAENSAA